VRGVLGRLGRLVGERLDQELAASGDGALGEAVARRRQLGNAVLAGYEPATAELVDHRPDALGGNAVVLGELVPKAVALQKAEALAAVLSVPLDVLGRIAHPVVWLLQVSSNAVLRLLRVTPAPAGMLAYTREDIRHSVGAAEDVGELEEAEEEMLYKVFDFASKEVSEVMVPRPDVVAISAEMPPEEALRAVVDSPFTRYPVYRGSLDDMLAGRDELVRLAGLAGRG